MYLLTKIIVYYPLQKFTLTTRKIRINFRMLELFSKYGRTIDGYKDNEFF